MDADGDGTLGRYSADKASSRAPARKTFALVGAGILVLAAAGYTAAKGLVWPHRTDGIDEPFSDYGGGTFGLAAAPGDERIFLDFFQHEPAGDVITIEDVTPGEAQGPVKVVEIAIAIRRPGEPFLVPGAYSVAPTTAWRECDAQVIADPSGYEVQPGEVVMLVERLRFTESGPGKLAPAEITFRRNGVRFRSRPGMHLEFEVAGRFEKERVTDSWESECDEAQGLFEPAGS